MPRAAANESLASDKLSPETLLLHIGPHKTGTTSIQSAFHASRAAVAAQGVHYAGPTSQPLEAVHAATGRPYFRTPSQRKWRSLVAEIRGSRAPRVVLSSEAFADADADAIRRIVDDLGRERVHVVVTLRPLDRILPSQWQQDVQEGIRIPFDHWLEILFDRPMTDPLPAFWRIHRHDQLVTRWAEEVGPGHVTAVVVDDRDHAVLIRVFEQLVGLRAGTLVVPRDRANRALTLPEVEVVRGFNVACHAEGIEPGRARPIRRLAIRHLALREPSPDERRVELPPRVVERTREIAREIVDGIDATGIRVIGDVGTLAVVAPSARPDDEPVDVAIPAEIAARFAVGVVAASGGSSAWVRAMRRFFDIEPIDLARTPRRRLPGLAVRRLAEVALTRIRPGQHGS